MPANHHEPTIDYNPEMALATVAWFKLYVDGTPSSDGKDWEAHLFGKAKDSLCGGADGLMKQCTLVRGTGSTPCA